MTKHLDKKEFLNPGLLIKYSKNNAPDKATKRKLAEATALSRSIMRAAVWKMDRVVLFHRPESYLTAVVDTHFRLGGANETPKERLRRLNKIRAGMLSLSFHLNTGTYLCDVDSFNRPPDVLADGTLDDFIGTRGYVSPTQSATIHLEFGLCGRAYSTRGIARIIIHEASHKYLNTDDVAYNYDPAYAAMTPDKALKNADSYAYTAVSIESKSVESSATMVAGGHHGADHS
jgi:hypothetical protein